MPAQILSFFRPAPQTRGDWSNQELAEFYRVEAALVQAGMSVETDRGTSDEGDPWFVFCRTLDLEVIVHFARIDGLYVISAQHLPEVLRGTDFRKLLNDLASRNPALMPIPSQAKGKILLHPAALLAAVVATLFMNGSSSEAVAAELDAGEALTVHEQDGSISLVADASLQDDSWLHRKTAMIAAVVIAAVSIDQAPISVEQAPVDVLNFDKQPQLASSDYVPIADPNVPLIAVQRADNSRSDRLDGSAPPIPTDARTGQWVASEPSHLELPTRELVLAHIELDVPTLGPVAATATDRFIPIEAVSAPVVRSASSVAIQASQPSAADTASATSVTAVVETQQTPSQTPPATQPPKDSAQKSVGAITVELVKLSEKAQSHEDVAAISVVDFVKAVLFDLRPLKTSHVPTESTQKVSLLVAERDTDVQSGKIVGLSTTDIVDTRDSAMSKSVSDDDENIGDTQLTDVGITNVSEQEAAEIKSDVAPAPSPAITHAVPEVVTVKAPDAGSPAVAPVSTAATQPIRAADPVVTPAPAPPPIPAPVPKAPEPVPSKITTAAPQHYDAAADSLVKAFVKTTVSLNVLSSSGNIILLDSDASAFAHQRFTVKTWALNDGSTLSIVGVLPDIGSLFG
jgi:hypothetical protein